MSPTTDGLETMHRHAIPTLSLLVALVAFAAPRPSSAGDLQLEGGVTTEYPDARSFDAVSNDNVNGAIALRAAYSLGDLTPISGLRGYLEINSATQGADRFEGAYDFNWSRGMYLLGADWGPEFWGFFRPFVRISAGYVRQQLQLQPEAAPNFSQRQHDFVTKDSIGFEVYLPYGEDRSGALSLSDNFTFGLSGQFGYLWQTPATYDELTASGAYGDDDAWSRSGMNLGEFNTNGLFWDVGVFMRFAL